MSSDEFSAAPEQIEEVAKILRDLQSQMSGFYNDMAEQCGRAVHAFGTEGPFTDSLKENYLPSEEGALGYVKQAAKILAGKDDTMVDVSKVTGDTTGDATATAVTGGRH
jgi:hypothetical protein